MAVKGLTKGAVFSEGGLHYMVDEVLPNENYISHYITEEECEKLEKLQEPEKASGNEAPAEGVPDAKDIGPKTVPSKSTGRRKASK